MPLIDAFLHLVSTALRLVLWTVAALAGLLVVSLGLAFLLGWILVNRLLGRQPRFTLAGRFQDLRQFGAGLGGQSLRSWGRRSAARPQGTAEPSPLRRRPQAGPVMDVEARDLPAGRP